MRSAGEERENRQSIQTKRRSLARRSRFRSLVAILRCCSSPALLHIILCYTWQSSISIYWKRVRVVFKPCDKKFQAVSTNPELIGENHGIEVSTAQVRARNVVSHPTYRRARWNPMIVTPWCPRGASAMKVCTRVHSRGQSQKSRLSGTDIPLKLCAESFKPLARPLRFAALTGCSFFDGSFFLAGLLRTRGAAVDVWAVVQRQGNQRTKSISITQRCRQEPRRRSLSLKLNVIES